MLKIKVWKVAIFGLVLLLLSIHIYYLLFASHPTIHTSSLHIGNVPQTSKSQRQVVDIKTQHVSSLESNDTIRRAKASTSSTSIRPTTSYSCRNALPLLTDTEFFLGSVVEKSFNRSELHVTVFLLNHFSLTEGANDAAERVQSLKKKKWLRLQSLFDEANYFPNGIRKNADLYSCRIKNNSTSEWYTSPAHFVPNRLSPDSNDNRLLDILRCRMIGDFADPNHVNSDNDSINDQIEVAVYFGSEELIQFCIPWLLQSIGYLLDPISSNGDTRLRRPQMAVSLKSAQPTKTNPKVHVCIPGVKRILHSGEIRAILEFVTHHRLIGVSHITLPVQIGSSSEFLKPLVSALQQFIDEGYVTIISQSLDDIAQQATSAGMMWSRRTSKLFQVTACLYTAKGIADYLLPLDLDEYFIPKFPLRTIQDVFLQVDDIDESRSTSSLHGPRTSRGMADSDGHPLCFLRLETEVVIRSPALVNKRMNHDAQWIGQSFPNVTFGPNSLAYKRYGYTRAVLPTRKVMQPGLSACGSCFLGQEWSPCYNVSNEKEKLFCNDPSKSIWRFGRNENGENVDFRTSHGIYEKVNFGDGKLIDSRIASVYHFRLFGGTVNELELDKNSSSVIRINEYETYHFEKVRNELRRCNLLLSDTSKLSSRSVADLAVLGWEKLGSPEKRPNIQEISSPNMKLGAKHQERLVDRKETNSGSSLGANKAVSLPGFAWDYSEFALSAIIERKANSFDLHVTIFFICHFLLNPIDKQDFTSEGALKVLASRVPDWKKAMIQFEKTDYLQNGERNTSTKYFCRIRLSNSSDPYLVRGYFVPNRLTSDFNSNRRLDIFRCRLRNGETMYSNGMASSSSNSDLFVEFVRNSTSIMSIVIPWSSRQTGYMLSPIASKLDPWKGSKKNTWTNQSKSSLNVTSKVNEFRWSQDSIYLCVPGLESAPSKKTMPLYLEFIQHHLSLGVDHIMLTASLAWSGESMRILLRFLQVYVDEGKVSVSSAANDEFDFVYSTNGLIWGRDNVKAFHVNMCTYFAKGMAEFVGVWDFDEFFIPRLSGATSIMDIVRSVSFPVAFNRSQLDDLFRYDTVFNASNHWKGARGMADGDGHPFCSLSLEEEVGLLPVQYGEDNSIRPWIGEIFSHGIEPTKHSLQFQKSIRPTAVVFQGGMHVVGACRLDYPWTGCDQNTDLCSKGDSIPDRVKIDRNPIDNNVTNISRFHFDHKFDEWVMPEDSKRINPKSEAVLYHLQFFRFWMGASSAALGNVSEYTTLFFPNILRELDKRNLVLPIILQDQPGNEGRNSSIWMINLQAEHWSSRNASHSFVELPAWAHDKSEFILGSILYEVNTRWNLAVFLLNDPGQVGQVQTTNYSYFCRIWLNANNKVMDKNHPDLVVAVEFTVMDSHDNLDSLRIFRCPIGATKSLVQSLQRNNSDLNVDLIRTVSSDGISEEAQFILLSFNVSWRTRCNCAWLPWTSTAYSSRWSQFADYPQVINSHSISLFVPEIKRLPSRQSLPLYLEFIQHHVLLGIRHIFLCLPYSGSSSTVSTYRRVFKSFIDDGVLELIPMLHDDYTGFEQWPNLNRSVRRTIALNLCSYWLKGVVSYIGVWAASEFLIPAGHRGNSSDFLELLSFENHQRPCEAILSMSIVSPTLPMLLGKGPYTINWLANSHNNRAIPSHIKSLKSSESSIYRVISNLERVEVFGIQRTTGCRTVFPQALTKGIAWGKLGLKANASESHVESLFNIDSNIKDATLLNSRFVNSVRVDSKSHAQLLRFEIADKDGRTSEYKSKYASSKYSSKPRNAYVEIYSESVIQHLLDRQLDLPLILPWVVPEPAEVLGKDWKEYNDVYSHRHSVLRT